VITFSIPTNLITQVSNALIQQVLLVQLILEITEWRSPLHCALRYRNTVRSSEFTGFKIKGRRYRKTSRNGRGRGRVQFYLLLRSALEGKLKGEIQCHARPLYHKESVAVSIVEEAGWASRALLDESQKDENVLPAPGFERRTVQPVTVAIPLPPLHVHTSYSASRTFPLNSQHPCSVFGRFRVRSPIRCRANIIDFSVNFAKLSRKYWDGKTNYGTSAYFRNRVQIPLEKRTRLLC
jgi:hypothetical protein